MKTQFAERFIFYGYEIKRKNVLLYFQNENTDFYIEQNKKEAKDYISKFDIDNFLFCLELENFIIIENKSELKHELATIIGLPKKGIIQKPIPQRQQALF
jgi:hypothetical protein